ncbi:unnamed protein product [Peniophora sp. CBMAI 1063]|nr:unnamed protein product [Peniophora sp. CBMAI 1063]
MPTIVIGDFSFPLEMLVGGKKESKPSFLEKWDLDFQQFCNSYIPDDTQMLDDGVDAAGGDGYTAGTGITNEELAQLQLDIHAAPKKYHRASVTRMTEANKVKKAGPVRVKHAPEDAFFSALDGTGVDGKIWGSSLSKSPSRSFRDQFGLLADALDLNPVHPVPAPAPAAKSAIKPGCTTTWPLFNTSHAHSEVSEAFMDWTPVETAFGQGAGLSSSSGSSSIQQQPINNTFSGNASPETTAPYDIIHSPASIGGETATNTQTQSTMSWAQEAAIRNILPSELRVLPTERREGVARAESDDNTLQSRVEDLIAKGGLLPDQHDDWLGIVRKNNDDDRLHRHTAFEVQLPIDVQISLERLRYAIYRYKKFRVPLIAYFSPSGEKNVFRCPICTDEIRGLRSFMRHIESTKHLSIIYLCNHEPCATNKQSCRVIDFRASGLNKHLKEAHRVGSILKKDKRMSAEA